MGYYKITNLTAKLPKRHQQKNSTLILEYRAGFDTKKYNLPVGGTLFISSPSLPVDLHKLRMKKLITVVEIGKNTFMKLQKPKPIVEVSEKPTPKPIVEVTEKPTPKLQAVVEVSEKPTPKLQAVVEKPKRSRKKKEQSTLIVKEEK